MAAMGVIILILGGYLIYNKNQSGTRIEEQQSQIATVTEEKSDVQKSFDASLARLDSMVTENNGLQSKLAERNDDINKAKAEIRTILNKSNASVAELAKAKQLISTLNTKISGMQQEMERLTATNQTLTKDLEASNTARQELTKEVDVASTLNASNITITPFKIKNNGKEKQSSNAKKVDKLVVSFDVNNRIAKTGTTDVFVVVIGPDGQAVNTGGGTFTTREEGDRSYSAKVPVEIERAKQKHVEYSFVPGSSFQHGSYKIEIYQNGFKIGEGTRELKKGAFLGLFS